MKKIYFIVLISIIATSCGLITYCHETPRTIKKSLKQTEFTPVTVAELKNIVFCDSSEYKVAIFYSPCCGACVHAMGAYYLRFTKANPNASFYFILLDTGDLNAKTNIVKESGIDVVKHYVIRDTTEMFSATNYDKLSNVVNYFNTSNKKLKKISIPVSMIFNENNEMKVNMNDSTTYYEPYDIRKSDQYNINKMTF
jgi:hypothetical protein